MNAPRYVTLNGIALYLEEVKPKVIKDGRLHRIVYIFEYYRAAGCWSVECDQDLVVSHDNDPRLHWASGMKLIKCSKKQHDADNRTYLNK